MASEALSAPADLLTARLAHNFFTFPDHFPISLTQRIAGNILRFTVEVLRMCWEKTMGPTHSCKTCIQTAGSSEVWQVLTERCHVSPMFFLSGCITHQVLHAVLGDRYSLEAECVATSGESYIFSCAQSVCCSRSPASRHSTVCY